MQNSRLLCFVAGIMPLFTLAQNVGIGTNAPFTTLDVRGDIVTSVHQSDDLHSYKERTVRLIGNQSGNPALGDGFTGMRLEVFSSPMIPWENAGKISFMTWGSDISATREVVTIDPYGTLGLLGNNVLEFNYGDLNKAANAGQIGYQVATNGLDIFGAGTSEGSRRISLFAEGGTSITGNVAIGAQNADFPLLIKADAYNGLIRFLNNTASETWHIRLEPDNSLGFTETGVADRRLVIGKGGNVGIGTTDNPVAKLDVNGNVNINGIILNEPWTSATLTATFKNFGSGFTAAAYYKDKQDRVYLKGRLVKQATGSGTIFTLPIGYRPAENLTFTSIAGITVIILSNGEVSIDPNLATNTQVSLDAISFRLPY